VNTSSQVGLHGAPGATAYSASKGAVIAFTKALALELASDGTRVNAICPVRVTSVDDTTGRLSGGNQQKVVFAKWLEIEPSVLLLDDPTRGIDVGTKAEMHDLIRAEAAAGAAVLLCSTDVDELAEVCDRVVIFFHHEVCATLSGNELRPHAILEAMNSGVAA
jgi:ABC-type sugar transport system ATPase subunit